jgi:hypothetical protein
MVIDPFSFINTSTDINGEKKENLKTKYTKFTKMLHPSYYIGGGATNA